MICILERENKNQFTFLSSKIFGKVRINLSNPFQSYFLRHFSQGDFALHWMDTGSDLMTG